jgi:hypothetical protein
MPLYRARHEAALLCFLAFIIPCLSRKRAARDTVRGWDAPGNTATEILNVAQNDGLGFGE